MQRANPLSARRRSPILVDESRILQVAIFQTLHSNLNALDVNLIPPDGATIADEVDSQLTQSVASYMKLMQSNPATMPIS
jgi:hypothetical protein